MASTVDLAILGLGGMGSSAAAHAARRGRSVVGIERFARGHAMGASSGRSRIIRKAYFEHPAYVPLLLRAYELWAELERLGSARVLDLVGLLMVGAPESEIVRGAARSAREYGLPLDALDAAQIRARFPGTHPREDEVALFEREAGIVFPEAAIAAYCGLAERAGAELRFETGVVSIERERDAIVIQLDGGDAVRAERLAVCAGPWIADLIDLPISVRVQRNVQVWFEPESRAFGSDRFPAFFIERAGWPAPLYGFPDAGHGVKAAFHALGETTKPDDLRRGIGDDDIAIVRAALNEFMPGAGGRVRDGKACMYALTPDRHFILDRLPDDDRITVAGGFSGHGFKFASVIGEIVADLACDGGTRHPIELFSMRREQSV